jgi:hypothetical protein
MDGCLYIPCGAENRLTDYVLLQALAHEIRHVYQFKHNILVDIPYFLNDGTKLMISVWKGRVCRMGGKLILSDGDGNPWMLLSDGTLRILTDKEYTETPWEVDADNYAKKCVKKYYKRLNK